MQGSNIVTTSFIPGKKIVKTICVISREATYGVGAWTRICWAFAHMFGRRADRFSGKIDSAAQYAFDNIRKAGENLGGNAIVGIRIQFFRTSVMVYGTLVVVEDEAAA